MTTHEPEHPYVGRHLIADFSGVDRALLCAGRQVTDKLVDVLTSAGFHVADVRGHEFPGGGFTSLVLLTESHASLHSYPELAYLALDLFSCGTADPKPVLDELTAWLNPERCHTHWVDRGPTAPAAQLDSRPSA